MLGARVCVLTCVLPVSCSFSSVSVEAIQSVLQSVAERKSSQYNCSISIAYKGEAPSGQSVEANVASGVADFTTGRQVQPSDAFVWGSGTKVLTGASVLRLVSQGKFGLNDHVAPLLDPWLASMNATNPAQNFSSLADLWPAEHTEHLSVKGLLHMSTGVPDFDTAYPCDRADTNCTAVDSLRASLYAQPEHSLSPIELLNLPWVRGQWTDCEDGTSTCYRYSSTSYMLLGLLLAAYGGGDTWDAMSQGVYLSKGLQEQLHFVSDSSPPSAFTEVHGYDRTVYNVPVGEHNEHDNIDVAGVFSGWTASDMVGSVPAVAQMAWEVYREKSVAPPEYVAMMTNYSRRRKYGLATQIHRNLTGQHGVYGEVYGHCGATYGYQSFLQYFPALDFVLAGASNIELDYEEQIKDTICFAYNEVAALLLGRDNMTCSFDCSPACHCYCTPLEQETTTSSQLTTMPLSTESTTATSTSVTELITETTAQSMSFSTSQLRLSEQFAFIV